MLAWQVIPIGNTRAPKVRIKPGAFSWYHGEALVETTMEHPKPNLSALNSCVRFVKQCILTVDLP